MTSHEAFIQRERATAAETKLLVIEAELADARANALHFAQAGERLQDEVARLRMALMDIWRYPKGWEKRGSIRDYIAEVVHPDARTEVQA